MVQKTGLEPVRAAWATSPSNWRVYQFHHFCVLNSQVKSFVMCRTLVKPSPSDGTSNFLPRNMMPIRGTCRSRIRLFLRACGTAVSICTATTSMPGGSPFRTFFRARMLTWAESITTSCPDSRWEIARCIIRQCTFRYPRTVSSFPKSSFRISSEPTYSYCGCCLAQVVFPAPGIPTIRYRVAIRLPPCY